jgi:hypothetical protein
MKKRKKSSSIFAVARYFLSLMLMIPVPNSVSGATSSYWIIPLAKTQKILVVLSFHPLPPQHLAHLFVDDGYPYRYLVDVTG